MNASWRKILGNSGWQFADRLFRQGGGILISIAIARHLGPQYFGDLSFAIAFSIFFAALAKLGLDTIVVREIVRQPERSGDILGAAFALKLLGGVLALSLAALTIRWIRPHDPALQGLVVIVAAGIVFQAFDTADLWFQSQVQSRWTAIARGSAFVVLATTNISLIVMKAPVEAFAWTAAAEAVLCAIGFSVVVWRAPRPADLRLRVRWQQMVILLRESGYLIFAGIAVALYLRLDQMMLAEFMDNKAVGLYSAALKLSEMWYVIPTVIVSSATPYLTTLYSQSSQSPQTYNEYRAKLQQLLNMLMRVAFLIVIPMVLLARVLMQWLYGAAYAEAGLILSIHIVAAVFVFQGVGISAVMVIEQRTRLLWWQTLAGVLCNIALNSVLIPLYGAAGAAVALVLSQLFVNYGVLALWSETRHLFNMETKAFRALVAWSLWDWWNKK